MDKSIESYKKALESEIKRWNGFAVALRKPDREAFEELMDMFRNNALTVGNTCTPIMFEQLVMSILLCQQKKLPKLEYSFNDAIWQEICKHKNTLCKGTRAFDQRNYRLLRQEREQRGLKSVG